MAGLVLVLSAQPAAAIPPIVSGPPCHPGESYVDCAQRTANNALDKTQDAGYDACCKVGGGGC